MRPGSPRRALRPPIIGWLTALAVLGALPAHALQVVEARDGVAVEAILSIKEPTRIRIEGAPIVDVFGNIHSSQCGSGAAPAGGATITTTPVNPSGEVVIECDRDKGEIYVRPVASPGDPSGSGKPVNLFISSPHATYTLVLRRADTPADTIVIRDRSIPAAGFAGPATQAARGSSPNHVRAMKALLIAMASDRVPADIRVEESHQSLHLWAEARFSLMRRYEGRGLTGEKYLLQNVSASMMVLAEQEFDRPDSKAGGQVLGVAIEHHNLKPGETTNVFVIRRGGER
jgi:conjugal transfer pilus assembly protein TraK